MARIVPIVKKYSNAFKLKVVGEVESGKLSLLEAKNIYEIGGSHTIKNWIKKMGKSHLISKVVRVELKEEENIIKRLRKEKQELESALANSQVKLMALETLVEIAKDKYGIELKKKTGKSASTSVRKRSRKRRKG